MAFLFFLISFLNLSVYSERIELKDGTVLYGDFEGMMDNYYIIRTKYGVLSVSSSDVISQGNISLNMIQKANSNAINKELKIITKKTDSGYERYFYENSLIVATQSFTSDGVLISSSGFVKDGIYYEYDEKGNMISEKTIKNSMENGPVIEFYPDGIVKSRMDFKDGKVNGKAFFYTPDSRLILEQSFLNGVLNGYSIEYDPDGNVKSKVFYSNGKLAKTNELVNELPQEIVDKENKESKNKKESTIYSIKILNIARGKKVFIYKNNKYLASFTFDNDYNIIDITGEIPDGEFEVKNQSKTLVFKFSSSYPVGLKIMEDGRVEREYSFNEDGKAIKK